MGLFDADDFVKSRRAFFFTSYLVTLTYFWNFTITGGTFLGINIGIGIGSGEVVLSNTLFLTSMYFAYIFWYRTRAAWQRLNVDKRGSSTFRVD